MLNPWWKENRVSNALAPDYRRKVFPKIKNLFKVRQIIMITGLRRVGKSTLMYQLIDGLLSSGINPERALYFSFDEKTEDLMTVLKKYSELVKVDWKSEKCFLFLDEIQKLDGWSNKLKVIYDNFQNLKIIISGSSSFQLEKDAKLNLAGRHFAISVEPLSFTEYLEMKGSKIDTNKLKLWEEEIKKEFKNYLLRPFPELVRFEELSLIKSYIRDNITEKVLKIDLTKKFKNINEDLLTKLIEIFYEQPGTYINYDELANDLKVSKKTLIQHFYYLEFAYVIRRIKNFRPGIRVSSRKLQRAYPFHFSLGFGWNGNINFETAVASLLDAKHYWREGGKEIDFLILNGKMLPVEAKETQKVSRDDMKHLLYFMKKFKVKNSMLVYEGIEEKTTIGSLTIKKIPLWKLFLEKT